VTRATSFRRVGLVANPQRAAVPETVRQAVAWLGARGVEVLAAPDLPSALGIDLPTFAWDRLDGRIDLLLTFGGDGTILYAARRLAGQDVPIFGVNTGSLGFLTSSSRLAMLENLGRLFDGLGESESHMTLGAEVARTAGEAAGPWVGLNDVVIHKGGVTARVLELRLEVEGDEVGTYVADGLILATPVGSTGYALSAQGPLVVPTMDAIVATPICPHTLAIRPVVLPPDARIEVGVLAAQEPASLAVDGVVEAELHAGDRVAVRRGPHRVPLVRLPGGSFFRLLRSKLHWGGRASHE
jgi:NAD+ kinase